MFIETYFLYLLLCISKLKNIQLNKNMAAFPQLGYGFKSNTSDKIVDFLMEKGVFKNNLSELKKHQQPKKHLLGGDIV